MANPFTESYPTVLIDVEGGIATVNCATSPLNIIILDHDGGFSVFHEPFTENIVGYSLVEKVINLFEEGQPSNAE